MTTPILPASLLKQIELPDTNLPWLWDRTIFLTEHGSQCYGLSLPTSDTDYKGVAIAPLKYHFGYLEKFEQAEFRAPNPDMAIYDLRKFFKLAADCNPSIIEVLYTDRSNHMITTELGATLLACRWQFISKKAKHTFSGYAISQLKKLLASKERPPERLNPLRAESVLRFGYDTKDAMHTVRLLKMGLEIMRGEGVIVRRPDREELLAIRAGEWQLDDIIKWADSAIKELDYLYVNGNAIPNEPDRKHLDFICEQMIRESFGMPTIWPTNP